MGYVKVHGIRRVTHIFSTIGERTRTLVAKSITDIVKDIERDAKKLVPVRTGELKESITSEQIGYETWSVTAEAPYAGYVEFGVPKPWEVPVAVPVVHPRVPFFRYLERKTHPPMKPVYFMKRASERHVPRLDAEFRKVGMRVATEIWG